MNRKKSISIIIMVTMLLTFTGCAQINIATGVDYDNSAYLAYTIKLDLTSIDKLQIPYVVNSMKMVLDHYEKELDFEILKSDVDLATGECSYSLEKRVPNNNPEQAFNTLKEMLTDETITPFMQVDMDSKITKYQHLYSFKGELDFAAIYKATNIESFPPYMQDIIAQYFEASNGNFSICLPGIDVLTATNNDLSIKDEANVYDTQVDMTSPFKFNQKSTFELTTSLNTDGEKVIKTPMENILQTLTISRYFGLALGAMAFIAILVGIVLHSRKNKSKDESRFI